MSTPGSEISLIANIIHQYRCVVSYVVHHHFNLRQNILSNSHTDYVGSSPHKVKTYWKLSYYKIK